jgi:hypothetical protein
VEAGKPLGRATFTKHSIFAGLHYYAARKGTGLLAVAGVNAVCERRGHKAGYEKDQCNNYQQEQH